MQLRLAAFCLLLVAPALSRAGEPLRLVFIPRDSVHPFWQSVRAGADQARTELAARGIEAELEWAAPPGENDVAAQIRAVTEATRRRASGIILAPLDRKDLAPPVEAAAAQGIPVLTVDAGVDSRAAAAWVGSNNYAAGQMAGMRLGQLLGGEGNVFLLRHHIHSADTEEREEGFLEAMQNVFPRIRLLVTDFHAGPTAAIAGRVVPSLLSRDQGRVNGIFCSSECAGAVVLAELRRRDLAAGKVKFVAVEDEGNVLRDAVARGDVQGLVVQDPTAIGARAVRNLVAILRHQPAETTPETTLTILGPAPPARGQERSPPPVPAIFAPPEVAVPPDTVSPAAAVAAGQGTIAVPDLGLILVGIPPGTFTMGSAPAAREFRDTDTPLTRVTLSRAYWLGKFETTQREWNRLMPQNPSDFVAPTNPVDNVSWEDAAAFCRRLNERERHAHRLPAGYQYSLPTEAQWEYACRAGTTGARAGTLDDLGWYVGNSGAWVHPDGPLSRQEPEAWRMTTHPVGQKQPNAWGLYDMYGNVLEWCQDFYAPYSGHPVTDPAGADSGSARILRGGGWWTDPEVCFSFSRAKAPPGRHHNALGFRLALVPATPPSPAP